MKKRISTDNAPAAIGPYSQGIDTGSLVFVSGQGGRHPQTNALADDVVSQAEQVFKNIGAILSAGGCTYDDVVKCLVFLKDMNDFAAINEVYKKYFGASEVLPARSCVEVSRLPGDLLVEVEAIAVKK